MKDLMLSVLLMLGMAWWAIESTIAVGAGNWLPFSVFFVVFVVALVVLGCYPLDAATVDRIGGFFGLLTALALIFFAIVTLRATTGLGVAKLILALAYGGLAILALRRGGGQAAHA